jgi:predicted DsbA family dithiol-disulfide isomerase
VSVEVTWRPFEIHPEVPLEGMPVSELPYPPEQWARMQEALRQSAAQEGLVVGNRPKVSNTHRALAAGTYAQVEEPERFPAFHEALFKGYFAEGRDLGDPDVVDDLARASGLEVARMNSALAGGAGEAELAATRDDAARLGITGTPTYVFERRLAAVGAQPAEVLIRAIETIVQQRDPGEIE